MKPCNLCGKCCKYGEGSGLGSASRSDVIRWQKHRPDILEYAPPPIHELWISPVTGEETRRCPWLRKLPKQNSFVCRIHEFKPDVCRNYPLDIAQMIADKCEMLEPGDMNMTEKEVRAALSAARAAATR